MAVAGALVVLWGCGVKTAPVSPGQVVPRPITDLRYNLDDKGVTLSWSYPSETMRGDELQEIAGFDLYRAVIPLSEYCDTCPIPYGEPIRVDGGMLSEGPKRTASYTSTLLRPGHLYFFKVRSHSGWWSESLDSNEVSFTWFTPAKAAADLKAVAGDSVVTLNWRPVTERIDSSSIDAPVRYQVMRSLRGDSFSPLGEPTSETRLEDNTVSVGRTYFYQVQTQTLHDGAVVSGGVTEPISAAPIDLIPPAPPVGLTATISTDGFKLLWIQVHESDLKGFRVYRRLDGSEQWILLGEVTVPSTLFIDTKPPEKTARWFYAVTAIDNAQPPNESERSIEALGKR